VNTPVVIIFFNRPDFLRQLVSRLSEVKPTHLYLVCDGPRLHKAGEREKVEECRALFEMLSWDCRVYKNYSEVNLGCRDRIISGLDWVFGQEECAIILEDDCIPIPAFFPFAETMLKRYEDESRIFSIGGTNLCPRLSTAGFDIVFCKYAMIWGWATWRRRWLLMERDLSKLPQVRKTRLLWKWLGSMRAEWYWCYILKNVVSTWDYQWAYTAFINRGLHILPAKCLVQNIGLADRNATHTTFNTYELPVVATTFSSAYRVPKQIEPDQIYNTWIEDHFYSRSFFPRIRWMLKKVFNRLIKRVSR